MPLDLVFVSICAFLYPQICNNILCLTEFDFCPSDVCTTRSSDCVRLLVVRTRTC